MNWQKNKRTKKRKKIKSVSMLLFHLLFFLLKNSFAFRLLWLIFAALPFAKFECIKINGFFFFQRWNTKVKKGKGSWKKVKKVTATYVSFLNIQISVSRVLHSYIHKSMYTMHTFFFIASRRCCRCCWECGCLTKTCIHSGKLMHAFRYTHTLSLFAFFFIRFSHTCIHTYIYSHCQCLAAAVTYWLWSFFC